MFMWKKVIPRCIYLERGRLACDPQKRTLNIYICMCTLYYIILLTETQTIVFNLYVCQFGSWSLLLCLLGEGTLDSTRLDLRRNDD